MDPAPEPTARQALLTLNALPGMGPILLQRLAEATGGDVPAVLRAPAEHLRAVGRVPRACVDAVLAWRTHFDPHREEQALAALGARYTCAADPDFPEALRRMPDPPIALNLQGELPGDARCVAIIGTRRPTLYGRTLAHRIASDLAASGCWIVSGLARGIDTAAHEGALDGGGRTLAVLGCGLDITYPPENAPLRRRLLDAGGGVVSEFSLGRQPDVQTFPIRNRIIAALARFILIVESDLTGGAMITARFAADYERTVGAVPGRADMPSSRGCLSLLRDGAQLIRCAADVLDDLDAQEGRTRPPASARAGATPTAQRLPPDLTRAELDVIRQLRCGRPLALDDLVLHLRQPTQDLATALVGLELRGLAARRLDGTYESA